MAAGVIPMDSRFCGNDGGGGDGGVGVRMAAEGIFMDSRFRWNDGAEAGITIAVFMTLMAGRRARCPVGG